MSFTPLDWAVLVLYAVITVAIGYCAGRFEKNTFDYFLGGRRQHWVLVGLSILATELSAVTFVLVPAESFRTDWNYLQLYAGALVGRVLIAYLLLPAFYGGSVTTVYEYLGQRFGPWTRTTTSVLFVVSRVIGSGIRLLAACLALSVVFGWRLEWVVLGAAGVAIAYTTFGGIKSIIWTDAFQALVFLAGAVSVVVFIVWTIPGDLPSHLAAARAEDKLKVFTFTGGLNCDKLFWVLLISSTVQNMAALGVDQDLTQRMLTCPDLTRGQRSLILNALIGLPVVSLFLLIGTLMYIYYGVFTDQAAAAGVLASAVPGAEGIVGQAGAAVGSAVQASAGEAVVRSDRIFPWFIANALPAGLRGLLVAGVLAAAMSSLDSALGALSSTTVTDFCRPLLGTRLTERRALSLARWFTVFFGAVLAVIALGFARYDQLLWEVFKWAGLIFGPMLGVFLLGVLTKKRGLDRANPLIMLTAVAALAGLKFIQERTDTVYIAWPWWVVIGTAWTFGLGASLSRSGR